MARNRKPAAQNNNSDTPPKPKRNRGRQNGFSGVKLEFLDGFGDDFLQCTTLADVGAFYDMVTRKFVDRFGHKLCPEENPPSALESSSTDTTAPSVEAQEAENEARNNYCKGLRKKLGNWYRHRFKSKDRSSTIMHILDSFSSVKPRRRLAREVYAELYWETKLKAHFDEYTKDLGDDIPSEKQLATRNKFLVSKLRDESPEVRLDVEERIEFEYQSAMEEWNTASESTGSPESYRSAWNLANEVLPELSNALGQWLGGSVIIAAVAPEDGTVKVKTVQSSTSNGSLSLLLAERNPEGWKSFCKMYCEYGNAYFTKADMLARKVELKKDHEASAEDAPKQAQPSDQRGPNLDTPPPCVRETSRDSTPRTTSPNSSTSSAHDELTSPSPTAPEAPHAHPSVSTGSSYAHVSPVPLSATADIVAASGLPSTSTLPQPGGFLASLQEFSMEQPFNGSFSNGWPAFENTDDVSMTPWTHPNYQSQLQSSWFNSGHSYPPSVELNASAVASQAHLAAYGGCDGGLSMSYPMSSVRGLGSNQNIDPLSTTTPRPPAFMSPRSPTSSGPTSVTVPGPIPVTPPVPLPPTSLGPIPTPPVPLPPTSSGPIPTSPVPLPPNSGPIPVTTSGPLPPTASSPSTAPDSAPKSAAGSPVPDKESPVTVNVKTSKKRTAKENVPAPPTQKRKANQVDEITPPTPSVAPRRTRAQRTASGQASEPPKARTSTRLSEGAGSPKKSRSSKSTKTPMTGHQSKHGGWFTRARGTTPEPYYPDKLPI